MQNELLTSLVCLLLAWFSLYLADYFWQKPISIFLIIVCVLAFIKAVKGGNNNAE